MNQTIVIIIHSSIYDLRDCSDCICMHVCFFLGKLLHVWFSKTCTCVNWIFNLYRAMKHELRHPAFLCKDLDKGNVCPACPKARNYLMYDKFTWHDMQEYYTCMCRILER